MDYSTKMGVLWKKNGSKGEYMTGNITIDGVKHDIVLFQNNKRPGKQDADFQIFPSQPREQKQEVKGDDPEFVPF